MPIYEKAAIGLTGLAPRTGRIVRAVQFVLAALGAGSRTVALADNSQVIRELSQRAKYLFGSE